MAGTLPLARAHSAYLHQVLGCFKEGQKAKQEAKPNEAEPIAAEWCPWLPVSARYLACIESSHKLQVVEGSKRGRREACWSRLPCCCSCCKRSATHDCRRSLGHFPVGLNEGPLMYCMDSAGTQQLCCGAVWLNGSLAWACIDAQHVKNRGYTDAGPYHC